MAIEKGYRYLGRDQGAQKGYKGTLDCHGLPRVVCHLVGNKFKFVDVEDGKYNSLTVSFGFHFH